MAPMAARVTRAVEAMVSNNSMAVNRIPTMAIVSSSRVMNSKTKAMDNSRIMVVKVLKATDSSRVLEGQNMDQLHHNISSTRLRPLIPPTLGVIRRTKAIRTNTGVREIRKATEGSWGV